MEARIRHRAHTAFCLAPTLAWLALTGCRGPAARDPEGYYKAAVGAHRRGEYRDALARARGGASDNGERDQTEWHWRFRLLEAETLISMGETAPAIGILEPTPGIKLTDEALEARRLLHLGWALSLRSEHEKSLDLLNNAALLAGRLLDQAAMAEAELRRGTVLGYLKRFAESEQSYRQGLEMARKSGDPFLIASALGSLGFLRLNTARYEEAIYYFEQVMPFARELASKSLEGMTIQNLAWCYFRLGDLEKAARQFERAHGLFRAIGKVRDEQISLGNLGSIQLIRGEYRKAIESYQRAFAVAKRIGHHSSAADWLSNMAVAYLELGDLDAAAAMNRQAAEFRSASGDRQTDARLMINEGRILTGRGKLSEAEFQFRRVAESGIREPTTRLDARSQLAELMARQGRIAEADRQYREVLEELQDYQGGLSQQDWKMRWQASLMRFYKAYVDFLWKQGRRREALEVAESSRARVLAEGMGGKKLDGAPNAERMTAFARRTGCTLLSYWLSRDASYAWVITGSTVDSHELPPQPEISAWVESYRRVIERLRDPLKAGSQPAERLAEALLGRIPKRSGCFVISPDQELHGLNFEALPVDGNRYWIEQAEISIVPSLALETGSGRSGGRLALLIGDPAPADPREYPELIHAGRELDDVARLLAPAQVTLLRGAQATPGAYARAEPGRFAIIHIASHATANRESPLDSAVVLAREGEKYTLPAREIAGIPLSAKLVTLSACRGAGARAFAGEGTVGLAWAFLRAGASSVIAGLWAVDDVSTARLMSSLYASLSKGREPAAALRAAKLELIRSASSLRKPFYWAPFQVYRLP